MEASAIVPSVGLAASDAVTRVAPGASAALSHLSNDEVLARTRQLVGKTNQLLAALLSHLGEVEARGLHRTRACASLYTYCIYELRFSEDAASRRASAARVVRQFPAALEAIAAGELHLTGLLQLAPVLKDHNCAEILARAKFRTKKEIANLVRRLAPLPTIPDSIEPLGPELPQAPRAPSWAELVESLCPTVRELPAGERPSDWVNEAANDAPAHAETAHAEPAHDVRAAYDTKHAHLADAPSPLPPLEEPDLYQIAFATNHEHVQLIERAMALLSSTPPKLSLGELHLQAMRLLVSQLETKKYGAPRQRGNAQSAQSPRQRGDLSEQQCERDGSDPSDEPREHGVGQSPQSARQRGANPSEQPRQRGRYVSAVVRRGVFERDGGRCAYVDGRGMRCPEVDFLEFHHRWAFAKGGGHTADNLELRCSAHNTLAAEQDFGRTRIEQHRHGARHDSKRNAGRSGAD